MIRDRWFRFPLSRPAGIGHVLHKSFAAQFLGEVRQVTNKLDAAAIERVCFDDARRDELIGAGRRRLQMFSWDRCARETLDAYREVVG